MSDTRYWSKQFMTLFIEEYKSLPCLWKVRSKEYNNKKLKKDAYQKLIKLCESVNHESNRDFVVKKIQGIRGSFRKELRKVLESQKSSPDDVYVPNLWYFDLLMFTKGQEVPKSSSRIIPKTEDIDDAEEHYHEDISSSEAPEIPESSASYTTHVAEQSPSTSTRNSTYCQRGAKRRNSSAEHTAELTQFCKASLNESQPSAADLINEYEAVGISVGKKLQRMDPIQAILAESVISIVLKKGLLNSLTDRTNICESHCSMMRFPKDDN